MIRNGLVYALKISYRPVEDACKELCQSGAFAKHRSGVEDAQSVSGSFSIHAPQRLGELAASEYHDCPIPHRFLLYRLYEERVAAVAPEPAADTLGSGTRVQPVDVVRLPRSPLAVHPLARRAPERQFTQLKVVTRISMTP